MIGLGLGLAVCEGGGVVPGGDPAVKLWLRADLGFDGTGWLDQSGSGKKFVPGVLPTLVASGINGLPTLAGNGTSAALTCATFSMPSQPFTVYIVAQMASQASVRGILSDGGGNCAIYANSATTVAAFGNGGQDAVTHDATAASVYRAVYTGDTGASFRASPGNASQAGTIGWNGTGGLDLFSFAGTDFWDKWISEIIVRAGAPDAATEAYLSARYGITIP